MFACDEGLHGQVPDEQAAEGAVRSKHATSANDSGGEPVHTGAGGYAFLLQKFNQCEAREP